MMASYMTDQKVLVITTFCSSRGFCVSVAKQYNREYSVRVTPSTDTIYWIIKLFEYQEVYVINM
jgi:hypothetical protein